MHPFLVILVFSLPGQARPPGDLRERDDWFGAEAVLLLCNEPRLAS
jgi:hypothetical protein